MKRILTGLIALLFIGMNMANAQSTKKAPPPPPPPKKVDVIEKVAPPPPKVVDEEVKLPPPPVITITGKQADEFYKRNPSVADISRQGSQVTLKMKDGTTEKYNMNNKAGKKNFTGKYGKVPIPDPPPPPTPPKKIDVKEKHS